MKLLLCLNCQDIFKLTTDVVRRCKCGMVKGKYESDGHTATVNGEGVSLALDNNSLVKAFAEIGFYPIKRTKEVAFWVRPHEGVLNPNTKIDRNLK